jgi:hypothetical protein
MWQKTLDERWERDLRKQKSWALSNTGWTPGWSVVVVVRFLKTRCSWREVMILFCGSMFRTSGDRNVFSDRVIMRRGDKYVFVITWLGKEVIFLCGRILRWTHDAEVLAAKWTDEEEAKKSFRAPVSACTAHYSLTMTLPVVLYGWETWFVTETTIWTLGLRFLHLK